MALARHRMRRPPTACGARDIFADFAKTLLRTPAGRCYPESDE